MNNFVANIENRNPSGVPAYNSDFDQGAERRANSLVVEDRDLFRQRVAQKMVLEHFEHAAQRKWVGPVPPKLNGKVASEAAKREWRARRVPRSSKNAEKADDSDHLEFDAAAGIDEIAGTEPDLEDWVAELSNRYERQMTRNSMTEQEKERFKEDNDKSIQAGINAAALLRQPQSSASGAIDRLRTICCDDKERAAPSALKMVTSLTAKLGKESFLQSMQMLRMEIGAGYRVHTAADLGWGGLRAYQMGAAFHLMQSAADVAFTLRAKLCDVGITSCGDHATLVMALLKLGEGEQSRANHLVNAVVERQEALSPKQKADFYRLVDDAVNAMPTTLWPPAKLSLRANLLGELDGRIKHAHERLVAAHPSPEAQLESKLRRQLVVSENPIPSGQRLRL